MKNLKNWFLPISGFLAIILDQGFDVVNPLLIEIGLPEKWLGAIKALFGLYAVYKMATNKPILKTADIGGTKPPIDKDQK